MKSVVIALLALPSVATAFIPSALHSRKMIIAGRASTRAAATAEGTTSEVDDAVEEKLAAALAEDIMAVPPADASSVFVLPDATAVGVSVFDCVDEAAEAAIAEKGHFLLGIPGGSILKMLAGTAPSWASKTTVAYVNHKCVDMGDEKLATHAKACKLFLDDWEGINVITLGGSGDSAAEAASYEKAMRDDSNIPTDPETGLPVFDMMLVGVGDDGHVGSLYPDRDEVLVSGGDQWVLPVDMKTPGSITLSLPVMAGAKEVVIAACGVSDKYPQGKSAGMVRAIEGLETLVSFPASGLRGKSVWILDEAAASKLSPAYTSK
uniref:Glucosamine/galactosamine-6-phosphate isomerase domain-containing protein n=1 Tax=Florenciella parvula TaxID=236787 RepID=A0A7S2BMB5_9STRA